MGRFLISFLLLTYVSYCISQASRDAAVLARVEVQTDPPAIILKWPFSDQATQYQIFRKDKTAVGWGIAKATLQGEATSYTDGLAVLGKEYEYKIVRAGQGVTAYGYVMAGIRVPVREFRGRALVLADVSLKGDIDSRLPLFLSDLEGDGWSPSLEWIDPALTVKEVKAVISQWYAREKSTAKSVVLLGHIPVPYSGNLNPDGHPDHQGAWPADAYYGDIDGIWTDASVNSVIASDVRNKNVPADGKFDQNTFPSAIELQVGRVDFNNLPLFTQGSGKLLAAYLDKNHAYRHKIWSPAPKALIDDNFGYFSGEAFAATGWRNFSSLCQKDQVAEGDYFTAQKQESFLWSYGCGPGSYTSAGGIGTSVDFSKNQLNGVFTILFGSYFGDWDSQNNLMRSALAQGKILTCAWGGRPHWYFHHMGLGENIGYSALLTQNNNGLYYTHYAAKFIHISLLGDPTLRNDIIAPPSSLMVSRDKSTISFSWMPSPDSISGYNIYLKKRGETLFTLLNASLLSDTRYEIPCITDTGTYVTMVKAVHLTDQSSGSYFNTSQGIYDTLVIDTTFRVIANARYTIDRNTVSFFDESENATQREWSFDNGVVTSDQNPVIYLPAGQHTARLVVSNSCSADTVVLTLDITSSVTGFTGAPLSLTVSPNPASTSLTWNLGERALSGEHIVSLYNAAGQVVWTKTTRDVLGSIDIQALPPGIYQCCVQFTNGMVLRQGCIITR